MDNHPLNGQSRLSRRQPRDYRVTQRVTPYGGRSECAGGLQNAALSAGTAVPGPRCEGHNSEATVRRPQFGRLPIISHEPDLRLPDALSLPRGFRPYIRSQPPGTSGTVAPTSGRCSYGPSYSIGLTISGAKAAVLLAESNRLIAFCVLPAYRETSQRQAASLGGS